MIITYNPCHYYVNVFEPINYEWANCSVHKNWKSARAKLCKLYPNTQKTLYCLSRGDFLNQWRGDIISKETGEILAQFTIRMFKGEK